MRLSFAIITFLHFAMSVGHIEDDKQLLLTHKKSYTVSADSVC